MSMLMVMAVVNDDGNDGTSDDAESSGDTDGDSDRGGRAVAGEDGDRDSTGGMFAMIVVAAVLVIPMMTTMMMAMAMMMMMSQLPGYQPRSYGTGFGRGSACPDRTL